MLVSTVLGAIVLVSIIMNEATSDCRFCKLEGFYMRVSTVLRAIVLVLIIMNEATSDCRFCKLEGFYMLVSAVLVAIVLVLILTKLVLLSKTHNACVLDRTFVG